MAKKITTWADDLKEEFPTIVIDLDDDDLEVIPTGSYSIDYCTGVRGIPRGRFTEIYGPESSAKTTLSLGICKNAIKQGLKVLYVDVEQTLDYGYIEKVTGLTDKDNFVLVKPKLAEDAFELMEKAISTGEYGLIILDSIGALSPKKEIEDDFSDMNVALVPRLITKFLRRNAFDVRINNIAVLFINQVRDKIGAFRATYTTPGGHAIKHYASLIISLSKGQEIKKAGDPVGLIISFVIKKNKLAPPGKGTKIPLMYNKGIDSIKDLIQLAEVLGVVVKAKGGWYTFEDQNIGHGMQGTIDTISANEEVLDKIVNSVYNSANAVVEPEDLEEEIENDNPDA
jgi:recombination protein RecA